jgi:hypothetical protein
MNQPLTKFVGANPFTKAEATQPKPKQVSSPKKMPVFVNVEEMSITNDALPAFRAFKPNKYDGIFGDMRPGQCIRCTSENVNTVANAMRKFVITNKMRVSVKSAIRYEKDVGYGRVWMMPAKRMGK